MDLLIETIHQIGARVAHKIRRKLLEDFKCVTGLPHTIQTVALIEVHV